MNVPNLEGNPAQSVHKLNNFVEKFYFSVVWWSSLFTKYTRNAHTKKACLSAKEFNLFKEKTFTTYTEVFMLYLILQKKKTSRNDLLQGNFSAILIYEKYDGEHNIIYTGNA